MNNIIKKALVNVCEVWNIKWKNIFSTFLERIWEVIIPSHFYYFAIENKI